MFLRAVSSLLIHRRIPSSPLTRSPRKVFTSRGSLISSVAALTFNSPAARLLKPTTVLQMPSHLPRRKFNFPFIPSAFLSDVTPSRPLDRTNRPTNDELAKFFGMHDQSIGSWFAVNDQSFSISISLVHANWAEKIEARLKKEQITYKKISIPSSRTLLFEIARTSVEDFFWTVKNF